MSSISPASLSSALLSSALLSPCSSRRRYSAPVVSLIKIVVLLSTVAVSSAAFGAAVIAATSSPIKSDRNAALSLYTAQQLAVERSRQLVAQDYSVDASRDMAVAAAQLPDPVIKFGVNNLPIEGANRFSVGAEAMTMRSIGLMQTFTGADKRHARAERYEREVDKTLAEKSTLLAAIERDTALAWLERYYAEAMAAVIVEQGQQARLEIQAADGAYRGGRGSQADILSAHTALAEFDDRASLYQRRIRNAKTSLMRWIGSAAALPLADKPVTDTLRINPAALDSELAHHPQINVLSRQEDIAAADADIARANKQADWSVELAFQQRGPAYSNMVSVGVSIPLQWNQQRRQEREYSAKLALVEQAKAKREEALRAHIAEVRLMINEWENNRERLARFQRELMPLANDHIHAMLAAYQGGKAGLNEVLAARRSAIDVRLRALQLEADTSRLWAQINFLFPLNAQTPQSTAMPNKESK